MPARVSVLPIWNAKHLPKDVMTVSTVSRADGWSRGLSPFILGPCPLYKGFVAKNVENAWQFSKLYEEHAEWRGEIGGDMDAVPTKAYWRWARKGWKDTKAHRYPMGKGARPICSVWHSEERRYRPLGYVQARKAIYGPVYANAVVGTEAWKKLKKLYRVESELILLDFDAYDHKASGKTCTDVLNDPDKKMGHAFVLAMLLTDDPALEQFEWR